MELLVAGVHLVRGSVPGVVVRVMVVVGCGDGGRSCRGAVWGVEVVRLARFASGSHDSVVWDFPILRGPLRHQGRRTTVRLLRAMLGLGSPIGAVGGVGPGCTSRGPIGGQHPRLAVNVGVGVWVVGLVWWWGRGRCFPRAPLTLGVLSVSRGGPPVVLTSG